MWLRITFRKIDTCTHRRISQPHSNWFLSMHKKASQQASCIWCAMQYCYQKWKRKQSGQNVVGARHLRIYFLLIPIFFPQFDNPNEINHLIFCSINLMVIKLRVCTHNKLRGVRLWSRIHYCIVLHKSGMLDACAQYGSHSFLSGSRMQLRRAISMNFIFPSMCFHHFNVSTHGDSRREKRPLWVTRQQFNWMCVRCLVSCLPVYLITKAWQLQHQLQQPSSQRTRTDLVSVSVL